MGPLFLETPMERQRERNREAPKHSKLPHNIWGGADAPGQGPPCLCPSERKKRPLSPAERRTEMLSATAPCPQTPSKQAKETQRERERERERYIAILAQVSHLCLEACDASLHRSNPAPSRELPSPFPAVLEQLLQEKPLGVPSHIRDGQVCRTTAVKRTS